MFHFSFISMRSLLTKPDALWCMLWVFTPSLPWRQVDFSGEKSVCGWLSLCFQCFASHLLFGKHEIGAAGAEDVAKAGAQLAAVAGGPADAHVGGHVLLDTHVALVVAVLADGDALKTRTRTLQVGFAAQVLLRRRAGQDFGRSVRHRRRVLPRHGPHGESVEHFLRVVERVGVRVRDEVAVRVDVVGVEDVAEGEGLDCLLVAVPCLFAAEVGDFEARELPWEARQCW